MTDLTARAAYGFRRTPRPREWAEILRQVPAGVGYVCVMTEGRLRLVANHGDHPLLAGITDHLFQSSIVRRWPGGLLDSGGYRRFVYHCRPEVMAAVSTHVDVFTNEASVGVFDPHFLYDAGSLWFGSVSGDRVYWLELESEDRHQISSQGGILESLLSADGDENYLAPMDLEAGANWLDPDVVQEQQ